MNCACLSSLGTIAALALKGKVPTRARAVPGTLSSLPTKPGRMGCVPLLCADWLRARNLQDFGEYGALKIGLDSPLDDTVLSNIQSSAAQLIADVNDADDPDLLHPAAVGLYGRVPLKEQSQVVECTHCGRIVAEQRFAAHLQTCKKVQISKKARLEEEKRQEEVRSHQLFRTSQVSFLIWRLLWPTEAEEGGCSKPQ
eukprot:scaffold2045_cov404-Prasinococcus_capsulatus_cf.AAC.7